MANNYKETRKFDLLADELFIFCRQALDIIKYGVPKSNPALGIIHAKSIMKSTKFEIEITPLSESESNLSIEAYNISGIGVRPVQYPRRIKKQVDDLWQVLDQIVMRSKTQYG